MNFIQKVKNIFKKEPKWKNIYISESEKSYWEFLNNNDGTIKILYVPNTNYSKDDVEINMITEQFEDLLKFIKKLD